jgi:hypothetical protein
MINSIHIEAFSDWREPRKRDALKEQLRVVKIAPFFLLRG